MPTMSTRPSTLPRADSASPNSRSTSARSVASPDQGPRRPPRPRPWPGPPRGRRRGAGAGSGQGVGDLAADALAGADDDERPPVEPEPPLVVGDRGVVGAGHVSRRGRAAPRPDACGDLGDGLDLGLHLALVQLGDDLRAEQLDGAHDRLVRQVAELHVADELVHAQGLVLQHLLEALLGVAHHDHVRVAEPFGSKSPVVWALRSGKTLSCSSSLRWGSSHSM